MNQDWKPYEIFDKKKPTIQAEQEYLEEISGMDTESLVKVLSEWFDSFCEQEYFDWERSWRVGLDVGKVNKKNVDVSIYSWLQRDKSINRKIVAYSFLEGYWGAGNNVDFDVVNSMLVDMGKLSDKKGLIAGLVDKFFSIFHSKRKSEILALSFEVGCLTVVLNKEFIKSDLKDSIAGELAKLLGYLRIVSFDETANDVSRSIKAARRRHNRT